MKKHFYHQAILEICTCKHLTVDEIFAQLQVKYADAGRSTIYRNVEELTAAGKLRKLSGVEEKALFERIPEQAHAHFVCKNTGKIIDIDLPDLSLLHFPEGFTVDEVRIYGNITASS